MCSYHDGTLISMVLQLSLIRQQLVLEFVRRTRWYKVPGLVKLLGSALPTIRKGAATVFAGPVA